MTTTTGDAPRRLDGCPRRLESYNAPIHTEPDGNGGVRATYRCAECRHCWSTSWAPSHSELAAAARQNRNGR